MKITASNVCDECDSGTPQEVQYTEGRQDRREGFILHEVKRVVEELFMFRMLIL